MLRELISSRCVLFVQLLICVRLYVTLWTVVCQASIYFTISWSLLKFMFIELVMLDVSYKKC